MTGYIHLVKDKNQLRVWLSCFLISLSFQVSKELTIFCYYATIFYFLFILLVARTCVYELQGYS